MPLKGDQTALWLRALGDGRWQAEGDLQDHVNIHGNAVTSRGLKLPRCYVLKYGALHGRARLREQSDAIELAILSESPRELNSLSGPAARRHLDNRLNLSEGQGSSNQRRFSQLRFLIGEPHDPVSVISWHVLDRHRQRIDIAALKTRVH